LKLPIAGCRPLDKQPDAMPRKRRKRKWINILSAGNYKYWFEKI
jgi:hypothetical protein